MVDRGYAVDIKMGIMNDKVYLTTFNAQGEKIEVMDVLDMIQKKTISRKMVTIVQNGIAESIAKASFHINKLETTPDGMTWIVNNQEAYLKLYNDLDMCTRINNELIAYLENHWVV